VACNLSFRPIVKSEKVLTGSHVHFKSGSILQTVLYTEWAKRTVFES